MSNTQNTPGPWRVEPPKGTLCAWTIEADRTIAFIARTIGKNTEEDANARLIAAAPELLEALERTLARLESNLASVETCDLAPSDELAIEQARAALAKAEGNA